MLATLFYNPSPGEVAARYAALLALPCIALTVAWFVVVAVLKLFRRPARLSRWFWGTASGSAGLFALGTFGAEWFHGIGQSSDEGKKYYKVVDGVLQRKSRFNEKDPDVIAAIARARATFPEFAQALRSRHPAHPYFSVRRPYATPDGGREHLWIEDVREIAGGFEGTLAVEPDDTRLVTLGQRVRFTVQEISDWLYLEDDRLVGGYTIRYVTDRMTPEEKRRFEQESGFRVP